MGEVVNLHTNEMEKGLRELAMQARKENIDYCLIISQKEVDGYLEWCLDEVGEKTVDHDHITSLLGHLFSFSQHVFLKCCKRRDQQNDDRSHQYGRDPLRDDASRIPTAHQLYGIEGDQYDALQRQGETGF